MREPHEPTIGLLELDSIAAGIEVTDSLLKEATVRPLFARPFSPGKYAVLFTGSVEDVKSALRRGHEIGADAVLDAMILPSVADGVLEALDRPIEVPPLDAVGIVETLTIGAALRAADAAVKRGSVDLIELRLAQGIGGKSYFTLTGEVSDVETATLAGATPEQERGLLIRRVVIARPHPEMRHWLAQHERPVS